jgi:hypothetical protein
VSFFRHGRSTGPMELKTNRGAETPLLIVRDESHRLSLSGLPSGRARLRFTGCAHHAMKEIRPSNCFQPTAICGLTGCLNQWVHPTFVNDDSFIWATLEPDADHHYLYTRLVGRLCGLPIRSNWRAASFLQFVASCLSSRFASPANDTPLYDR